VKGLGMKGVGFHSTQVMGADPKEFPFLFYTTAQGAGQTVVIAWVNGGKLLTVDWGDGSAPASHATTLSHIYANPGTKEISIKPAVQIEGWRNLTSFDINTCILVGGIPDLSRVSNIQTIYFNINQLLGNIPELSNLPALQSVRLNSNLLSGNIPSLLANPLLTSFRAQNNALTGYVPGGLIIQGNLAEFYVQVNSLPQVSIDRILRDFVISLGVPGRVVCLVDLSGIGNSAPSNPGGLADKATLNAAGWTVTTN